MMADEFLYWIWIEGESLYFRCLVQWISNAFSLQTRHGISVWRNRATKISSKIVCSAGTGAHSHLTGISSPSTGPMWGEFSTSDHRNGSSGRTLNFLLLHTISEGEPVEVDEKQRSAGKTTGTYCSLSTTLLFSRSPRTGPKRPAILEKHKAISTVVAHIGTNDTTYYTETETLKDHFKTFLNTLKGTGTGNWNSVAICGPLPSYSKKFSLLLSLNSLLKSTCNNFYFTSIENFDLFWGRPAFFKCGTSSQLQGNTGISLQQTTIHPTRLTAS